MRVRSAALLLGALLTVGCKDTLVPDLNNPSLEGVIEDPTRSQVQSLATGLVIGNRAAQGPYVRDLEIVGRDAYNLDAADPRWITEFLISFDPGGFGGGHWDARYRNIKGANVMMQSVSTATRLTDEEKSAATGFARTMKALDLLGVIETRDTLGVAADAGVSTDELAPIVCRDPALAIVSQLLDQAKTELLAGGEAFPFVLPSGFDGFSTPATFLTFNRGIAAKAEIYRGKTDPAAYTRALAALDESFVDPAASLDLGVYHNYSLSSGDAVNPLFQDPATANYRAHPSVRADAEAGDERLARKTAIGPSKTYQNVGSDIVFTLYDGPTAPLPIMRNEELILLRAQANLGAGNLGPAQTDLNTIRVRSGGLATRSYASVDAALDDLLQQKRYSLLFESGSHWIDLRQYGRLDELPVDQPTHNIQAVFLIPQAERLARGGNVACTTP